VTSRRHAITRNLFKILKKSIRWERRQVHGVEGTDRQILSLPPERMVLCDPNDDETVLVLPSGKKTHSAYIEEIILEMIPCVSHAFVCGSHHDFLVTLLSLKLNPDMGGLLLGEEALQLARE
jgi:hypothetical protein